MKIVYAFVLLVFSNLLLCGCVETRPLISHAHLGHVMTAWHDTPHQRGLLAVARDEADTALSEAKRVWMQGANPDSAGKHVKKVILALNPELLPGGNWRKQHYGIIRALEGTLDHLEYAANSEDASLNMVSGVAILVGQGGGRLSIDLRMPWQRRNPTTPSSKITHSLKTNEKPPRLSRPACN